MPTDAGEPADKPAAPLPPRLANSAMRAFRRGTSPPPCPVCGTPLLTEDYPARPPDKGQPPLTGVARVRCGTGGCVDVAVQLTMPPLPDGIPEEDLNAIFPRR